MKQTILIPLFHDEVAPRFDLATDVMLVELLDDGSVSERIIVLPHASADELCSLAISDKVDIVVCGGIEDQHYQYLEWKGIKVIDNVSGAARKIISELKAKFQI